MSGAITGAVVGGLVGGSALAVAGGALAGSALMGGGAMFGGQPQMPQVVAPQAPPPMQAMKAATPGATRSELSGAGQGGGAPGVGATLLTGPGGIGLDTLKLGKSLLSGA